MRDRIGSICLWILIGVAAISWTYSTPPFVFYSSDNIYPWGLFSDLVHAKHTLKAWNFPNSPCFFPEIALYFPGFALFRDLPAATLAYGALNAIFLAIAMYLIARDLVLRNPAHGRRWLAALAPALFIAFAASGAAHQALMHWTFIGHSGVVNLAMILIWALLRHSDPSRKQGPLFWGLLTAAFALTWLSDRLVISEFAVPLAGVCAAVLALCRWRQRTAARARQILIWLALSSVLAYYADRLLRLRFNVQWMGMPGLEHAPDSWKWFKLAWLQLWQEGGTSPAFLIVLSLCMISLMVRASLALTRVWREGSPSSSDLLLFYFVAAIIGSICAPILMAIFDSPGTFRYCLVVFVFPFFEIPHWLEKWLHDKEPRAIAVAAGLASIALLAGDVRRARSQEETIFHYYPPLAQCLDRLHSQGLIHDGLASYWHAKHLGHQSRTGFHLLQMKSPFDFFHWGNSWDAYRYAQFDFVLMRDFDPELVQKKLGAPSEILQCEGVPIFVYRGAAREPLAHYFNAIIADYRLK